MRYCDCYRTRCVCVAPAVLLCMALMCCCALPGVGMGAGDVRFHHRLLLGRGPPGHAAHQDDGPAALGHQALVGPLCTCTVLVQCCPEAGNRRCLHACRPYYLLHYTYGMDYTMEVSEQPNGRLSLRDILALENLARIYVRCAGKVHTWEVWGVAL